MKIPPRQVNRKCLLILTVIFFLVINTTYLWEGKLGFFAFITTLLLLAVYLVLVVVLIRQVVLAVREKFSDRFRTVIIVVQAAVVATTFFFPRGVVSFDRLEGEDMLVAQQEGVANCMTTIKLKEGQTFVMRDVCFGIVEVRGDYEVRDDTVFFSDVSVGRGEQKYFAFAVIKPGIGGHEALVAYKDKNDTSGYELRVIKNNLPKP